jgi:Ras-related protein Rab-1A
MTSSTYDYLIKCLVIGDAGTGKSSIMMRFADDVFCPSYISTIGVDFKIRTMEFRDKIVKYQIWDTAGQERFRTLTSSYYRGSNAILLCYDISDKNTFHNIDMWLEEVKRYSTGKPLLLLCGTKIDLDFKREVMKEEAEEYAKTNNMYFFESSSKNNSNITEIFELIAENKIITSIGEMNKSLGKQDINDKNINLQQEINGKQKNCC